MNTEVTLDNAVATWDALARYLEDFLDEWEHERPPAIVAYLPPADAPVLRRLALVEMVKADLDFRFARQQGRPLEEYIEEFPELGDTAGPPCDLIYEEFHVRKTHGEDVNREEFFVRFPGRRAELQRLLGSADDTQTTALFADKQPLTLKEGDQIDDFDLLARLGAGTFGSVFLARQRSISRLVALKVSADRGQEARMLAQLDHPNIVRVFDQRRLPERKLRLVYMQFAAGGTLADLVARAKEVIPQDRGGGLLVSVLDESCEKSGLGPMADPAALRSLQNFAWPELVCRLGMQLAHALDYAHRFGILHRDVKPANILLAADGTPKLADFNISSLASHPAIGATAYFGGSLAYMSPEHLEAFNPQHERGAEDLDGRADLYSLAVVLWELLCGQKPFRDSKVGDDWNQTLAEMTARRRKAAFEPATAPSGEISRNLLAVLKRCLAPDPQDRPATGGELARELSLCVQPHTQRLVTLPLRGWRQWVRRFPVLAVLLVVTIPNAIAGGFNYAYNREEIIAHLAGAGVVDASVVFERVQTTINAIAFPLGALLVFAFVRPVARQLRSGKPLNQTAPEDLARLRRHALRLGHLAAVIGIVEWGIAGLLYPIAIHSLAGALPWQAYGHFFVSLVLCGLVAAAYPFFGVTFFAVRVFFPALLERGAVDPPAEAQLRRLSQQAGIYFLIACGVPLVGLALLIFGGSDNRGALITLAILSLGGLAVAFRTYGVILRDIAVLINVVRPADAFGMESTRS